MKKLILVTLLAVAASWLLSEARQTAPGPGPGLVPTETRETRLVVSSPSSRDDQIRVIPWRKGKLHRSRRVASVSTSKTAPLPAWFPKSEIEEEEKAIPDASGSRVLVGRISASEDRARQDLHRSLEREVADWIAADVPTTWKVPAHVIDSMARATYIQEVTRSLKSPGSGSVEAPETPGSPVLDDYYTLYRAGQKLDFSPGRKAQIVHMYRQDLAARRMHRLGGGLAMALAALAVLSTYIKADEATRGYYTNRLRLVAAAGLGVAGVVAYRYLV